MDEDGSDHHCAQGSDHQGEDHLCDDVKGDGDELNDDGGSNVILSVRKGWAPCNGIFGGGGDGRGDDVVRLGTIRVETGSVGSGAEMADDDDLTNASSLAC